MEKTIAENFKIKDLYAILFSVSLTASPFSVFFRLSKEKIDKELVMHSPKFGKSFEIVNVTSVQPQHSHIPFGYTVLYHQINKNKGEKNNA